jgi:hypothetical protein
MVMRRASSLNLALRGHIILAAACSTATACPGPHSADSRRANVLPLVTPRRRRPRPLGGQFFFAEERGGSSSSALSSSGTLAKGSRFRLRIDGGELSLCAVDHGWIAQEHFPKETEN